MLFYLMQQKHPKVLINKQIEVQQSVSFHKTIN